LIEPINIEALRPVARALESVGASYYIGGSIASSYHGSGRSTVDIDIIADLRLEHVSRFVTMLEPNYYADDEMIGDAIRNRSSFNVIHKPTSYKIDLFAPGTRAFDRGTWQRVIRGTLPGEKTRDYPLASAEDTILSKLEWYRAAGEVSERQWKDVIGVMKVQQPILDRAYLHRWATELNVIDLLDRAWKEAETP